MQNQSGRFHIMCSSCKKTKKVTMTNYTDRLCTFRLAYFHPISHCENQQQFCKILIQIHRQQSFRHQQPSWSIWFNCGSDRPSIEIIASQFKTMHFHRESNVDKIYAKKILAPIKQKQVRVNTNYATAWKLLLNNLHNLSTLLHNEVHWMNQSCV